MRRNGLCHRMSQRVRRAQRSNHAAEYSAGNSGVLRPPGKRIAGLAQLTARPVPAYPQPSRKEALALRRIVRQITLALCLTGAATAQAPQRVVSLNLCTDQLALLVAKPGQILALSALARDPMVSLMADQARALPAHHGRAEEIYLLRPDLVLAGDYTNPETLRMLRRLGLRVETLPTADTLAEVRGLVDRMGALLGSPDRAADVLADFDADLAALPGPGNGPVTVNYNPNGYTTGSATFAGDVQRQAGLTLLTDRLGMDYGGNLPLERLVMLEPDLIIPGQRYATPSRSEEILAHPALRHLPAKWHPVPDRDWICGLPQAASVAADLAQATQ